MKKENRAYKVNKAISRGMKRETDTIETHKRNGTMRKFEASGPKMFVQIQRNPAVTSTMQDHYRLTIGSSKSDTARRRGIDMSQKQLIRLRNHLNAAFPAGTEEARGAGAVD